MLRKALWDLRWTTFWYGLVAALYTTAIIAYFPYVRDNAANLEKLLQTYPKALLDAFGVTDLVSYSGFLGSEIFNVIWPVLIAAFAITAGSAMVAKEVEDGTADLWLSVPADRAFMLGGKLAALGLSIVALVVVSLVPVAVGARLVSGQVTSAGLLAMGAVMTAFVFVVAAYSALFSAFSSDRGRAAGLAGGLTLAFYLAWIISHMNVGWNWLGKLTIFTAYEPQRALASGSVDTVKLVWLLVLGSAAVIIALIQFRRRDILA